MLAVLNRLYFFIFFCFLVIFESYSMLSLPYGHLRVGKSAIKINWLDWLVNWLVNWLAAVHIERWWLRLRSCSSTRTRWARRWRRRTTSTCWRSTTVRTRSWRVSTGGTRGWWGGCTRRRRWRGTGRASSKSTTWWTTCATRSTTLTGRPTDPAPAAAAPAEIDWPSYWPRPSLRCPRRHDRRRLAVLLTPPPPPLRSTGRPTDPAPVSAAPTATIDNFNWPSYWLRPLPSRPRRPRRRHRYWRRGHSHWGSVPRSLVSPTTLLFDTWMYSLGILNATVILSTVLVS